MDGYSGGFGYLGGGFPTSSGNAQHESSTIEQHQISMPYSQQLSVPSEQDMLQSYPHLRHSIGNEFQSPVSPLTTQNSSLPRFPVPFPQLGSFPGFQNPELLQQFLDLQQVTTSRHQSVGNYSNIMNNYLHSTHSFMGQSLPSIGNLQLPQDSKSPVELHCSSSSSPARTSPSFSSYSLTSFTPTALTDTSTTSVVQHQFSVPLPNINASASVAGSLLQETYSSKVKQEPLHVLNLHSTFPGSSILHQEQNISEKIPDIFGENLLQHKSDVKHITERPDVTIPESKQKAAQEKNIFRTHRPENHSKMAVAALNDRSEERSDLGALVNSELNEFDRSEETVESENKSDLKRKKLPCKVKFMHLGSLCKHHRLSAAHQKEVLSELVDCEERIFSDIILNLPVQQEHILEMQKSRNSVKATCTTGNETDDLVPKSEEEIERKENQAASNELDDEMDDSAAKTEVNDYDADESHFDDSVTFDNMGIQDNWYSAAMKKYAELNCELSPEVMTPKKGGRSDPENPFAITSPSFSESAARALVVTTNSDNATLVMVSIMSIGSRKKLIPKLVDSAAAKGGIVSIVNPVESADSESKEGDTEKGVKSETTSIMSKLNREKEKEIKEENDNAIDRLDISIKIDDDQFLTHGEHKRWQCKLCPKSYTTKHNLVAHILDHCHIKPHLCLVCGKYFKQLSHLNTHMLTHDNVKPHVCDICHKGFTQISHLKRHQTVHCDSKPYICDICNRGFAYPSELRIHKDKHIPGKDKCVDCGMEFSNLKELREHMALHEHGNKLDLTCQHCDKAFRFPSQLRDHMMTHAGARPYMCTECGMDFMKEHHLKAHQFTHTGLRPYACPYCSRSFNQKANMVRHMLIHNAERAFKCEVCGKTFTQPQTLKAHMVVHAEKKPYSCKFCGKQFGRLHNLQGHLHIHNNTKPYVCSICGSSFTLKGNLNRHKKVKHGLNESMENMEEDAVNFLGNLSDRFRDFDHSQDEQEISRDESITGDAKSPKKGRKSIPRKRIFRLSENESDTVENSHEVGNQSEDDTERINELTYSEEERENEERFEVGSNSKYLKNPENSDASRRKRKQGVSYRVEDVEDYENTLEDTSQEAESITHASDCYKQHLGSKIQPLKTNNDHFIDRMQYSGNDFEPLNNQTTNNNADYDDDTETESENYEAEGNIIPEKRPARKRKRKCLAEGFVGENFEDDEIEGWSPQPTKVRKKKGAKLDSLIASKFKNV